MLCGVSPVGHGLACARLSTSNTIETSEFPAIVATTHAKVKSRLQEDKLQILPKIFMDCHNSYHYRVILEWTEGKPATSHY